MNVVIVGKKGSGKTTVASKLLALMEERGMLVGGVLCPGCDLIDVRSKEKRRLLTPVAECSMHHTKTRHYGIDECVFEFAQAVINKTTDDTWVFFDEYGHLELKKRGLHRSLQQKLSLGRCIVLIKDMNLKKFFSTYACEAKTYYLSDENRDSLPQRIFEVLRSAQGKAI